MQKVKVLLFKAKYSIKHQSFVYKHFICQTVLFETIQFSESTKLNCSKYLLLWIPVYGRAKAGRPARTYIQQLCEDTGCNPEDLRRRWMIGRSDERGSGISVLAARHDDDDEVLLYITNNSVKYQSFFIQS